MRKKYNLLIKELTKWANKNRENIYKALLTYTSEGLRFVVVMGKEFDYDLELNLYMLTAKLSSSGETKGLGLDTLCLPNCGSDSASPFLGKEVFEI